MKFNVFATVTATLLGRAFIAEACDNVTPTGVGDDQGQISVGNVNSVLAMIQAPFLWLPLGDPLITGLVTGYETPIQFRLAAIHAALVYNVAAMYEPSALDFWGRANNRICNHTDVETHMNIAIAYAFAYSGTLIVPSSAPAITDIMNNVLMLPMSNLDGSPDISTPWGLAKATIDEGRVFFETDGWNSDGSLVNEFNKMPYNDFSFKDASGRLHKPYRPKKNPKGQDAWSWTPLLVSNGRGYFSRQEFVTPHAGFTGRLYGLDTEEYEAFGCSPPTYSDYVDEVESVLAKTNIMATSDEKKLLVEFYDSKFTSLLPFQVEWSLRSGLSHFEFWFYDMTLTAAMYDATMLSWREKVIFNRVRPTTVVHSMKGEELTMTYAGPGQGSQMVKGVDWQPYIRTMPHAEYPSGSSCVCTCFAEVLQLLTGTDSIGFPLVKEFLAGSSRAEPGITPSSDFILEYNYWSEIADDCGESRPFGGMHFDEAVPAGVELCTGMAALVVNRARKLEMGDAAGAMTDFNDRTIHVARKKY
jgi:hypothetical protein